ncbi:hypothetical protein JCM6882_002415 [Rhodosporidiobolus microsporus]
MASRPTSSRSFLRSVASSPTLRFLHPALVVDWVVVFSLSLLGHYIERQHVYERDVAHYLTPFPDPSISYPHKWVEQVPAHPNGMLDQITFYAPIAIFVLVGGLLRWSLHDVHHAVLALWTSRELMRITVEFIKNRVGRLRPDFLSRCAWSVVEHACTGPPGLVKDGRRSFPSGHSSTAWQGLLFLTLYLAGKNGAFAYFTPSLRSLAPLPSPRPSRVPVLIRSLLSSHLLRLIVALAPLSLAVWIPITRLEDNYHHPTDILAGSTIGALCALAGYLLYFPPPWRASIEDEEAARRRGEPRMLYREREAADFSEGRVRLLEEDEEAAVGAEI